MSIFYMLIIALFTGIFGGIINYFLPANNPPEEAGGKRKPTDHLFKCIILGIGATLMAPLFLELAKSKLMEGITYQYELAGREDTARSYLLWLSYCLIAATAGFRFINMLISKVVTTTEVNTLKEKVKTQEETDRLNKILNQKNQQEAEVLAFTQIAESKMVNTSNEHTILPVRPFNIPTLPPGKDPDDTQKGRFGGLSKRRNRTLSAEVTATDDPDFYEVCFMVKGTDDHPLESDVFFYIDDTFSPSVIKKSKAQIDENNGIAEHSVEAWGAFTIGAITDFGETLLELDLSGAETNAPKKFKRR